ncbi:L,D-transpeptidase [Limosilactobacillus sp.]|uniref:L,D-transpeptidase n=1 Tax=Limosilactobacillus sp. TaxID=2773925 RepID=UPI00345EC957
MHYIFKRTLIITAVVFLVAIFIANISGSHHAREIKREQAVAVKTQKKHANRHEHKNSVMRTPIDYNKPSETKPYPDVNKYPGFWVKVSTKRQRVYIMSKSNKVLYTMYCSSGNLKSKNTASPTGTYHIQAERGDYFYSASEHEGALNYVSWLDHGVYMFHSVPVDQNRHVIKSEAKKLGKSSGSHGCIRLSFPDSRWMNHNLPEGTKVVIEND